MSGLAAALIYTVEMPKLSYQLAYSLYTLTFSLVASGVFGEEIDFIRDVRPILSENCVFCHGQDEATRKADLRLDMAEGAASVINKSSGESELYQRIISDDPEVRMPPLDSNRKLSPAQIESLRKWIDEGAEWEQHWSFRPLVAPPIPNVASSAIAPVRNPIDAFVQSKLPEHGLTPSVEAPRTTLIRRLCLDILGLPPTLEQVDDFLADQKPDAYERLVDRLLDSPAYGERMAWEWLDAARYADTNGYQGDNERTMWPWRDWVVKAFNENLPYDQFTIWQLAGDLLPEATDEQKIATGFCRNHMINGEGGRIAEENRVEYVMDMAETMGTVWMGLTLNCCRCHDHKYDPITNSEYYQLFAYFNQTPVQGGGRDGQMAPVLPTPSAEQLQQLAEVNQQLDSLDEKLAELSKKFAPEQSAWEQTEIERLSSSTPWQPLQAVNLFAAHSRVRSLPDHSVLSSGPAPNNDTYTFFAKTDLTNVTGLRLEALRHSSMNQGSLSQADSGNFVLTEIEVSLVKSESEESTIIPFVSAEATFEQGDLQAKKAFDGKSDTGWAVYEGRVVDRDHAAVFRFQQPLVLDPDHLIKIVLRHDSAHQKHNLGRFRLSLTSIAEPKLNGAADGLLELLKITLEQRTDQQRNAVARAHRESVPEYQSHSDQRKKLLDQRDNLEKSFPKVMIMTDISKPRETFILERGLYNKPKDPVTAKLPAFLPKATSTAEIENRLSLAKWLVDSQNPLTARVTVNRFWQQLFGVGLVKTSEDFGAQGEIPQQMDLLNWLAHQFQVDHWNVKNLIRLIVTSHTYRQSSKIKDELSYQRDPENRMLARGARYRLPSWVLRDQALAMSGLLSPHQGGPSVNTYQPEGVWEEASFGSKVYKRDQGEKLYRRSLYTFWRRIIAPTIFFDTATRQTCTVKLSRTNTPLHALQTLNNTTYVEAARVLAEAVLKMPSETDAARVDLLMRRQIARPAHETERSILVAGLKRTREQFQRAPDDAIKLVSIGESTRDPSLDVVEHAAWTSLALAVLNLDETLNHE
jgi:hypothetical protein